MRTVCFLLSLMTLLTSCQNDTFQHSNLMALVPEHTVVVVKTASVESLKGLFANNDLLNQFAQNNTLQPDQSKLKFLNHLQPTEPLLIAFGRTGNDSLQISVITTYHKDLFNLDSIPNHSRETITTKGSSIIKTTIEDDVIYSRVQDSIFFASTDRQLTEAAFGKPNIDPDLIKLFPTATNGTTLSILINTKEISKDKVFLDANLTTKLSDYYILEADLTQDQLRFDGITMAQDSSKRLINVFKNTTPQDNQISKVCPPDIDGFLSLSFQEFKTLQENLSALTSKDSLPDLSSFDSVLEAGILSKNDSQAVFLHSIDATGLGEVFGIQNSVDTYRDITIYTSEQPHIFSNAFSPFFTYKNATFYIIMDDYFIFSADVDFLKDIIGNYQNNATLYDVTAFEDLMANLSDASSLMIYANNRNLKQVINSNFDTKNDIQLEGFNRSAIQFVYENDFAHVHAVIQKTKKKTTPHSVHETANVTLEADVLTDPQFVNNHTNNQKEVVVQDVRNNLYLISKDGTILWKKSLDSKILGRIEQIDMYKNGRLQLAFATQHRVYVLDRAGKDVGPFPLKFNDQITQPLSVFDYDNTRNYRLMVTQGASVLMYDKRGKIVSGFNYKKAENTINTQPQHFRIGRKDYIVFVQGKEIEILSRVGKTRVNVKNNIDFSDSGIYLYDNKFTTTTVKGDLIQIDQNGKLSSSNLNLGDKHQITSTSKTLVTLSENILHIKTNKIELDFGDYTPPKIFYVNDKIYVSVTDLQAKKVYLFDSLGKSIANFPVYGNSSIDLDNIDKEKRPELVTKGGSNGIIIYQIN